MGTKTTNYNLEKPYEEEYYDIDTYNATMDIIDSELKKTSIIASQGMEETREELGNVKQNIGNSNDTGASQTTGTLFGKLNYLISNLLSLIGTWTDARLKKIDSIGIASDSAASSATPHTGADTATGSIHAKLNRLYKFTNSCNDLEYIKKTYSYVTTHITGNRMAKYDTIGWTGDTINGGDAYSKENATIHSKLNRIFQYTNSCNDFQYLKSAYELGTRGTVKSVQRGVTGIKAERTEAYVDQVITSVNLNKAYVIINPEASDTSELKSGSHQKLSAGAWLQSNNKIRLFLTINSLTGTYYVSWQVVEFY